MFESGEYVAAHVVSTSPSQVQPNGVDLTLDCIQVQRSPGRIELTGKAVGERDEVMVDGDTYTLDPGGYIARYAETVCIPEGHVGFVFPRSSLMRNSCMLNTAVWDAGYEGKGEGLLQVHHQIELERGARIAQLVLAQARHSGTYEGTYQGENL